MFALIVITVALFFPTVYATKEDCPVVYTRNGQTPPSDSFILPVELVTVGKKNSNGKSVPAWSGPFDSLREGVRYKGTTSNNIADKYLYQVADVTEVGGSPVLLPTSLTYCPLNMTKRPSSLVIDGVNASRYDIWWTLSATPGGIKREQCMALAKLPDANGFAISMSFQLNDGLSCPNDPVFPAPSGGSFATYKYALVTSANAATHAEGFTFATLVFVLLSTMMLLLR